MEFKGKKIHAEVKSLNSKALDLSTRIAPLYREKEMEIRQLIQGALERGKVDFVLWVEKDEAAQAATINQTLVAEYFKQIRETADTLGFASVLNSSYGSNSAADWMSVILRMPDVMTRTEVEVLEDEEWAVALQACKGAVEKLIAFRIQEGEALAKKFEEKIANISNLLASIVSYAAVRSLEQGRDDA